MKKVIILGPESTGKSSLGNWLSKRYHGLFASEYARTYFETHDINNYGLQDIDCIYRRQLEMEAVIFREAKSQLAVVDSSFITARIWSEEVFGQVSPFIEAGYQSEKADLYLLTETDIPWIADEQRKNEHNRDYLFNLFETYLQEKEAPYFKVSGTGEARYEMADKAVSQLLQY